MSNPVSDKGGGWGVFNPCSKEFKNAEKIFHEDLSKSTWHWRQAVVVIASAIGGLFFIVGAFPVFCWTARWLKQDEGKSATVTQATKSLLTKGIQDDQSDNQLKKTEETGKANPAKGAEGAEKINKSRLDAKDSKSEKTEETGKANPAKGAEGAEKINKSRPDAKDSKSEKAEKTDKADPAKGAESAEKINQSPLHPKADEIAFGKAQWVKYFGDVGDVPVLPANIEDILMEDCPIFKGGKKVWETHMLVLVPEKVNGQPLTALSLGELVERPKIGHASGYNDFAAFMSDELKKASVQSHWALITKEVIPGSPERNYNDQKEMLKTFKDKKGKLLYEAPAFRDMAVCIFMHHADSGERLFSNDPSPIYTRCQEVDDDGYSITIGYFSFAGVNVRLNSMSNKLYGMAASRKL